MSLSSSAPRPATEQATRGWPGGARRARAAGTAPDRGGPAPWGGPHRGAARRLGLISPNRRQDL